MRNFWSRLTSFIGWTGRVCPKRPFYQRYDGGNMSFRGKRAARSLFAVAGCVGLGVCAAAEEKKGAAKSGGGKTDAAAFQVPVEDYKLPNGLRGVLSQDHTAPAVCVAVYYRVGLRLEPKDPTGFAH